MRTHTAVAGGANACGETTAAPYWRYALKVAAAALLIGAAPAADAAATSREGDVTLHDFKLENGQSLSVLKLHYYALGTPKRDASGKVINDENAEDGYRSAPKKSDTATAPGDQGPGQIGHEARALKEENDKARRRKEGAKL